MPLTLGIIASSSASGLALTYRGSSANASGDVTYNNVPIGDPTPDRLVIVCAGGFLPSGNTATFSASSITIGGVNPTRVSGHTSLIRYPSGIFSRLVTSGTTINIATSLSSPNSVAVSVYTLTGYTSSTPFGSGNAASGSSYSPTISPTAPAAVLALGNEQGSGTFSWTNITPDYNNGSVGTNHAFSSAGALITSSPSISVSSGSSSTSYAWVGWQ